MKELTDKDWSKYIKSGDRIYFGAGASSPNLLINKFLERAHKFDSIELLHGRMIGETPWINEKYIDNLHTSTYFLGENMAADLDKGLLDYTPCSFFDVPNLISSSYWHAHVVFVQVAPPDRHGYCSLGVSVDATRAAVGAGGYVIAQINKNIPRTFGQSFIHAKQIDAFIEADTPLLTKAPPIAGEVEKKISSYVSLLIKDGATIHAGSHDLVQAVISQFAGNRDIGVHTGIFTNAMMDLMQSGTITNYRKTRKKDRAIASHAIGDQRLYDFLHDNPHVEFHPSDYVNQPTTIATNDYMVSINSANEIDLTGQVVADSVGYQFSGGIGGQVDFIRGAGMSKGGTPIVVMASTAPDGSSRIKADLTPGSGIVTARSDVHYIVTEYGIASLRGRNIHERALELIQVAHPDHRDQLLETVKREFRVHEFQKDKPTNIPEIGAIELRLGDGNKETCFLRPLGPSDLRRVQEFFYSLSDETKMQRYRHAPKGMTNEWAYKLVNTKQQSDLALCIIERQGPREIILAVGRYYLETKDRAEVAFVIRDEAQSRGLGAKLIEQLIRVAKLRKIDKLVAYVRYDNKKMSGLLEKMNFTKSFGDDPTERTFTLELSEEKEK